MAEPVRLLCPQCRTAYRLKVAVRPGATVKCSKCGAAMVVPEAASAPPVVGRSDFAGSSDDRQVTLTLPAEARPGGTCETGGTSGTDGTRESHESDGSQPSHESPLAEEDAETVLFEAQPGAGRYIEQAVIGRGGMGEVMLCIDRNTRRQIALKRILPQAASDPARRSRFVEEAQVTAQLEHPNIVPVHELDRTPDGTIYFTMKLVKGQSLAKILADLKSTRSEAPHPARPYAPPPARPYAPRGDGQSDAPRPQLSPSPRAERGQGGEARRAAAPLPPSPSPQVERGRGGGAASATHALSDLLQVFLKVCDGVAFAHSRGVIHRDLKPANIMVGEYGEVLVMDWGLAKILPPEGSNTFGRVSAAPSPGNQDYPPAGAETRGRSETARPYAPRGDGPSDAPRPPASPPAGFKSRRRVPQDYPPAGEETRGRTEGEAPPPVRTDRHDDGFSPTLDGSTVGTPAYMSPEQANGELDKIDPRSDIYSLGAILYEILTLERAIEGETPMMLLANAARNRIVPIEKRPAGRHVPRELAAIAMKCLAKSRAARYRSVLDLRRDIALFLEGRSVSAKPDSFSQAVVKLVKRNKGISTAVAAAAVVILALASFSYVRIASERDRAVASERRALDNEKGAIAARDQQRATALAASKRQAESAVRAASEGRFDEAGARATAAVEVMPDGPWGHYALGVLAHEKKDFASARKHLDEALCLDPAHGPSKLLHATVLAATGDRTHWEKFAAEAEKCTDWRALVAAGDALLAAERRRPATAAYQRALTLAERDPGIPEGTRAELKDSLAKATACLKMEGFWASVRNLPLEERRICLEAKVREIYQHGSATVERGTFLAVSLFQGGNKVRWLEPLKGLPLASLNCQNCDVTDLSPLKGMPLSCLNVAGTRVTDLSPLRGMPLVELRCSVTNVSDLSPLQGMQLSVLVCDRTKVTDLRPLRGMPLNTLSCRDTLISDLSPLQGTPLTWISCGTTRVSDLAPLRGMKLVLLDCIHTPVTDLGPLAGMPLRTLSCFNNFIKDLSPLDGMPLEYLYFNCRRITKGMEVLRRITSLKLVRPEFEEVSTMPPGDFWRKYDAGEFK